MFHRALMSIALVTAVALVPSSGSAASENAIATGSATFGDGASLSLSAVAFSSGLAAGLVTYRSMPGPGEISIQIDCMSFTPGGNVTTIGGDLFASGVDPLSTQRYFLRITDQFGTPGMFGAFVAVSTVAGSEPAQCLAEDLRGEPIAAGDFLFVRPAG